MQSHRIINLQPVSRIRHHAVRQLRGVVLDQNPDSLHDVLRPLLGPRGPHQSYVAALRRRSEERPIVHVAVHLEELADQGRGEHELVLVLGVPSGVREARITHRTLVVNQSAMAGLRP